MTSDGNENASTKMTPLWEARQLRKEIEEVINRTRVIDVHTHLFAPEFGDLNLYGIDELLTYHYLIAETFRSTDISPEKFWQLTKPEQADLVWKTLFVENSPISEATRGVITVLTALGLDPNKSDLSEARAFFHSQCITEHLERVFEAAGVSDVVMTNDPFDVRETHVWERDVEIDRRFHAALRLDRLLNNWAGTAPRIAHLGYHVGPELDGNTTAEVRKFLDEWIVRMRPLYLAVSLPDTFKFPAADQRDKILREVVLPSALQHKLPLALMIGVRRGVNPALRRAGDGVGRADVGSVERLCAENPEVRLMATFLSRENQHELCVAARKFSNLMPFGCWWFLNNPSIVSEITRERLELLGTSFIPQHSDASILEQLIYKWRHSREIFIDLICEAYERLLNGGRAIQRGDIERDIKRLFSGNFSQWVGPIRNGPTSGNQKKETAYIFAD